MEGAQKALGTIDGLDWNSHAVKIVADLFTFVFAHQTMIDENGPHVDASLVKENCKDRTIDPTRYTTDDLLATDLVFDAINDLALEIVDAKWMQTRRL